MFDIVVLCLGLLITAVLAGLKIAEQLSIGWLGVLIPLGVALAIVLVRHGADITDFIPD